MTEITKRLGAVLLALAVLATAMTGGAVADYTAPPNVDTSTTDDTSTTTELQSGDTLANFTGNASKNTTVQWLSDSNSTKVDLQRNGSSHVAFAGTSPTTVVWNSTDADGHFNSTFSHNKLLDVEHKPGENVTMDYVLVNNTSAASPSTTTQQWYIEWTNGTATETLNDTETGANGLAVPTNESGLFALDKDHTTVTLSSRDAPKDTYYIVASNSTVAADLSSADSNAGGDGELSSAFAPGANAFVKVSSSDTTVFAPVFASASDVPSQITDNNKTYAVVQSVGGTTGMAITFGDEFSSSDTLDIEMVAGTGTFGMNVQYIQSAIVNALPMTIGTGTLAVLPAFGFVARPRRRSESSVAVAGRPSDDHSAVESTSCEEPEAPSRPPTAQRPDDSSSAPRDRGGA